MFSETCLAVDRASGSPVVIVRTRPVVQVEIAVGVGRVALDRDLEGVPVELDADRAARGGVRERWRTNGHKLRRFRLLAGRTDR